MLTTFNECDMSAVMALRKKYQDDFVKKNGVKLGFMSFFVKAVVHALKEVPGINAQIDGDRHRRRNHYYDIGIAVSTEKGLIVPVIRNCDQLGMADIEKVPSPTPPRRPRDGKITLDDLERRRLHDHQRRHLRLAPLDAHPQRRRRAPSLACTPSIDRPVAVNGQVVIRPMMYLALSYDHRLVDGKQAVTFLVKVKQAIEDPARLILIGA